MKETTKKCQFRLTEPELRALDAMAWARGMTRSGAAVALLKDVTHQLQFGRYSSRTVLTTNAHTAKNPAALRVDIRVPQLICDYFKMNGYRLTTALALELEQLTLTQHGETD